MSVTSTLSALLLDLDNTLIDRDAAFQAWLRSEPALSDSDREELIQIDAGGHGSRAHLLAQLRRKLHQSIAQVRTRLEEGVLAHITAKEGARALLGAFAGPKVVITNGSAQLQKAKLQASGLRPLIDAVIVSEDLGQKKPHSALFRAALHAVSAQAEHALMIGDHPIYDIAGAEQQGIRGILLRTRWFDPPLGMPTISSLSELQLP